MDVVKQRFRVASVSAAGNINFPYIVLGDIRISTTECNKSAGTNKVWENLGRVEEKAIK